MSVTLNAAQTATLASISQTTSAFNTVQNQLNSGKKVNSASDDAVAYFQAQSLTDRASSITSHKSQTDQAIQSLNAAISATSSVDALLKQLKGVLDGTKGASQASRTAATQQFKTIGKQLAQLIKDASYSGLNLLTGSNASLSTQFSERTAATLKVSGFNLISSAASKNTLFTGVAAFSQTGGNLRFTNIVSAAGFSAIDTTTASTATAAQATLQAAENRIDAAISQNQAITASLGTNVTILQTRSSFADNYSSVLNAGSDKLTLADLNSTAAQSQALSLRQQIGIQSLSVENTQSQSILNLLR